MTNSLKLNKIKKRIWRLHDEPEFTKILYLDSGWLSDHLDLKEYKTGHAIYLDLEESEIISGFIFKTSDLDIGYFNIFVDYLGKFDLTSFIDILFAIDSNTLSNLYGISMTQDLKFLFKNHPIIDQLLEESQGSLIWHHQLENLYLFYRNNNEEATKFRKNILKKLGSAFNIADQVQIDDETTLYDVINDRMVFGGTIVPSMKEARKLYLFMNFDSME